MKRAGIFFSLLIGAAALADLPSSEPATNPATEPMVIAPTTQLVVPTTQAAVPSTQPTAAAPATLPVYSTAFRTPPSRYMSSNYSLLLQRSMFIHGNTYVVQEGNTGPRQFFPPTQINTPPEVDVVFNGADDADGAPAAFFEELSTHRATVRHDGEPICRGKVTHITLDSMDYEVDGRTTHVMLGENLNGQVSPSLVSQPVGMLVPGFNGPTSMPTTGPLDADESILERMKRRRLMGQ